jgi:hypothetical protein
MCTGASPFSLPPMGLLVSLAAPFASLDSLSLSIIIMSTDIYYPN